MAESTGDSGTMTELQMRDFVIQYTTAVCASDAAAVMNFHSENSVLTSAQEPGNPMARGEFMKYLEARQWAFPDFHFEATNIQAFPEKGIATFEWHVVGTFQNPLMGMPPNGRRVEHHGTTELHIVNGKIVRETSFQDKGAFVAQLKQSPVDGASSTTA